MTIDTLDKVLKVLYDSNDSYVIGIDTKQKDSLWNIDDRSKLIIFNKIASEGFATETPGKLAGREFFAYTISFDGRLFYESSSLKGRPFRSRQNDHKRNSRYTIGKTVLIALNAVAILFFSWLTWQSQDKSNQLEQQQHINDSLSNLIRVQALQIDSLHSSSIDTSNAR